MYSTYYINTYILPDSGKMHLQKFGHKNRTLFSYCYE